MGVFILTYFLFDIVCTQEYKSFNTSIMSRERGYKKMLDDGFHPTAYQLATFSVPEVKPKKKRKKKEVKKRQTET